MTFLNQSDFAKHIGVKRGYVTQLKTAGRLVMQDGKVDVEASVLKIEETKDPSKQGVAERHKQDRAQNKSSMPVISAQGQADEFSASGKAGSAYQQARAMREKYGAMQAKIAYEKEIKILLIADEARAAVADGDAIIRNRLESLPDTLAPQLAAENDEQKIRAMLMDQVEYLLNELSRTFYGMTK